MSAIKLFADMFIISTPLSQEFFDLQFHLTPFSLPFSEVRQPRKSASAVQRVDCKEEIPISKASG